MDLALLLFAAGNSCFIVWSRKTLLREIRETAAHLETLITGKVREVGPVEAQTQALQKQAVERATARTIRPRALNL